MGWMGWMGWMGFRNKRGAGGSPAALSSQHPKSQRQQRPRAASPSSLTTSHPSDPSRSNFDLRSRFSSECRNPASVASVSSCSISFPFPGSWVPSASSGSSRTDPARATLTDIRDAVRCRPEKSETFFAGVGHRFGETGSLTMCPPFFSPCPRRASLPARSGCSGVETPLVATPGTPGSAKTLPCCSWQGWPAVRILPRAAGHIPSRPFVAPATTCSPASRAAIPHRL
jgi:hypothetical protein